MAGERDAPMQFECDRGLDADDGQAAVYDEAARPLGSAVAAGGTACRMCYGPTGTGKTYTLGGGEAEPQRGVVDRALEQLLGDNDGDGGSLKVRMCYIEVYMEVIHDLLALVDAAAARAPGERHVRRRRRGRELRDLDHARAEVRAAGGGGTPR